MVEEKKIHLHESIARALLEIGAVSLRPEAPFTWASGLKSPIYCDNRLTMAYPDVRRRIRDGFVTLLQEHAVTPDVVAGTATAGIPHAAWLADRLDLPMAYVRSAPKAHGRGNQIEGLISPGQGVVVVEDLVSTGESSIQVVEAVREAGANVLCVLAIFTYGLPQSVSAFKNSGTPLFTLTNYNSLVQVALEERRIDGAALKTLQKWQTDPAAWSDQRMQP
ncbi:MAG TPA: orotate phosphoribosyltransferase [Rhodothermales bacterium]|nr:orotate phosphoribosyltransferase [Rhodothermales bacterium]